MTVTATTTSDLRSESVRSLYDQVMARCKDVDHLNGIGGILHWDQEVMMPSKAAAVRSEQVTTRTRTMHAIIQLTPQNSKLTSLHIFFSILCR